ncbi:unnamed protein product [Rotaria magnacalcarata]|uniref:Secreted protein n=1 Tax=Rotaria magnacalcarata TaxID=392030 RepID=A0A816LZZ6_9BILA|nr:unnamed protein product [Rotaria magnacalcarata]CAF2053902.1 unnamed protein product [Rotaria magnacalcarata]
MQSTILKLVVFYSLIGTTATAITCRCACGTLESTSSVPNCRACVHKCNGYKCYTLQYIESNYAVKSMCFDAPIDNVTTG